MNKKNNDSLLDYIGFVIVTLLIGVLLTVDLVGGF